MKRKKRAKHGAPWTVAELQVLKREWHEVTQRVLRSLLAKVRPTGTRQRSWCAVYTKARKLGLPLGPPQGTETLTAASKRTGYAEGTLKLLLRRQGVPLRRQYTSNRKGAAQGKMRAYCIDPELVDKAIAAETKVAPILGWAHEVNVSYSALRAAVLKAGLHALRTSPRGKYLLSEAQVKAALAQSNYVPRKRAA